MERLEKMHRDDQRDLEEFEEYFRKLEVEKAARAEKLRIEAEERAEKERAEKVLHDAAAKIQAFYRGLQCRKSLTAAKGKGGKKGKGKKKK